MVRAPQWRRPRVTSFCKLIRVPAPSAQHRALCPHSSRALRLSIGIAREARLIERNVLALQYSDGACPNQGVWTCQAQTAKFGGASFPGTQPPVPDTPPAAGLLAPRRALRGPAAPRGTSECIRRPTFLQTIRTCLTCGQTTVPILLRRVVFQFLGSSIQIGTSYNDVFY
jgi:hypothetical protein